MIRHVRALAALALALSPALPAHAAAQPAASPTRQLAEIDWEAARDDRAPRSAFLQPVNTSLSAIDTVSVPVLLPVGLEGAREDGEGREGARFFPRNTSYSATFEMDGVLVEITGSRLIQAVLESLETENNGAAYSRTDTAFGQQVSFTRYGAGYAVIITCPDPNAQPLCRDPDFALAVARSLRMAGGRPS